MAGINSTAAIATTATVIDLSHSEADPDTEARTAAIHRKCFLVFQDVVSSVASYLMHEGSSQICQCLMMQGGNKRTRARARAKAWQTRGLILLSRDCRPCSPWTRSIVNGQREERRRSRAGKSTTLWSAPLPLRSRSAPAQSNPTTAVALMKSQMACQSCWCS